MSYEYDLTLTITDTGENISQRGRFEADAWNLLGEFLQSADDLMSTKFVKDGMPAKLNIKGDHVSGIQVHTELPNWDDVTVFLHKFRPLGLESESTYFYKICSILTKELTHPYFRNLIGEQREIYSGKRAQKTFRIQSDDVVLNSEKILYDWLNSYEYHRDKEKRQFIESLHQMIPLDASKVLFIGLLSAKAQAIFNIAILVRVILGKQRSFESQIRMPD
jgi:hypothetical protein